MIAVDDDRALLDGPDFVLSVVPPGVALAFAERLKPVLAAMPTKPVFADCNADVIGSRDHVRGGLYLVDLEDRREACVPRRLRVLAPEVLHQLGHLHVGHHRQVRARMTGVDLRAALPFDDGDAPSRERQKIRRGQSRDACPDDEDIDRFIALELGVPRQRRGVDPERERVGANLHVLDPSKRTAKHGSAVCHVYDSVRRSGSIAVRRRRRFRRFITMCASRWRS